MEGLKMYCENKLKGHLLVNNYNQQNEQLSPVSICPNGDFCISTVKQNALGFCNKNAVVHTILPIAEAFNQVDYFTTFGRVYE